MEESHGQEQLAILHPRWLPCHCIRVCSTLPTHELFQPRATRSSPFLAANSMKMLQKEKEKENIVMRGKGRMNDKGSD